jgi:hypothetical protein
VVYYSLLLRVIGGDGVSFDYGEDWKEIYEEAGKLKV